MQINQNKSLFENCYNPDVLSCIANLSNDEVFTPPEIANKMLDMLPQELFTNPNTTFLDPACKSGVFLREIAKRLIEGLKDKIPDLQERINHIFTKQVFGIAITELTSLLSRRSVYCSKYPNCKYSVCQFEKNNIQGNIFFKNQKHLWIDGKCLHCGASQKEYSEEKRQNLESHAYQFIHNAIPGEIENMKFDVIIGNPPYQMNDGGAQASAKPIYHLFVKQAKKLNPSYMSFIIPARWYAGGKGLDSFRDEMLNDKHISQLHDFPIASMCFNGVEIKGGVCYFLWNKNHNGDCEVIAHNKNNKTSEMKRPLLQNGVNTFVRYNSAISILNKVKDFNEESFSTLVSARKPFGLPTNFTGHEKSEKNTIMLYENGGTTFVNEKELLKGKELVNKYKIYITRAYGAGEEFPHQILNKPILGVKNSACTETYLVIGPFDDEQTCKNVMSYISTKFFRALVLLLKISQDATSKVYQFVPLQDFSKPWSDQELYKKYNLTQEEIDFIETMIRPMG